MDLGPSGQVVAGQGPSFCGGSFPSPHVAFSSPPGFPAAAYHDYNVQPHRFVEDAKFTTFAPLQASIAPGLLPQASSLVYSTPVTTQLAAPTHTSQMDSSFPQTREWEDHGMLLSSTPSSNFGHFPSDSWATLSHDSHVHRPMKSLRNGAGHISPESVAEVKIEQHKWADPRNEAASIWIGQNPKTFLFNVASRMGHRAPTYNWYRTKNEESSEADASGPGRPNRPVLELVTTKPPESAVGYSLVLVYRKKSQYSAFAELSLRVPASAGLTYSETWTFGSVLALADVLSLPRDVPSDYSQQHLFGEVSLVMDLPRGAAADLLDELRVIENLGRESAFNDRARYIEGMAKSNKLFRKHGPNLWAPRRGRRGPHSFPSESHSEHHNGGRTRQEYHPDDHHYNAHPQQDAPLRIRDASREPEHVLFGETPAKMRTTSDEFEDFEPQNKKQKRGEATKEEKKKMQKKIDKKSLEVLKLQHDLERAKKKAKKAKEQAKRSLGTQSPTSEDLRMQADTLAHTGENGKATPPSSKEGSRMIGKRDDTIDSQSSSASSSSESDQSSHNDASHLNALKPITLMRQTPHTRPPSSGTAKIKLSPASSSSTATDTTNPIDPIFILEKYITDCAEQDIDACLTDESAFDCSTIPFDMASVSQLSALSDDMASYIKHLVLGFEFPEVQEFGMAEEIAVRALFEIWRRNKLLVSGVLLKDSATLIPLVRDKILLRCSNVAATIRLMDFLVQTIALSGAPEADADLVFTSDFVLHLHTMLDWSLGFKAFSPVSSLCVMHMAQALLLAKDTLNAQRSVKSTNSSSRNRSMAVLYMYRKQSPVIRQAHKMIQDAQEQMETLAEEPL